MMTHFFLKNDFVYVLIMDKAVFFRIFTLKFKNRKNEKGLLTGFRCDFSGRCC